MSGEDDYDKSDRNDNPETKGASKMGKQIVIIGAGLAGLAAARLLCKEGHNPILLDKGRRIGGRCGTRRVAGHCSIMAPSSSRLSVPNFQRCASRR